MKELQRQGSPVLLSPDEENASPQQIEEQPTAPSPEVKLESRLHVTATKLQVLVSSMSIRYKIAVALIMVLCLAIASLGGITFAQQKKVLIAEMKNRADVLIRQLAASGKMGLLTKDDLQAFSTLKDIQKTPGVVYAMILDKNGEIFVHNDLAEKGKKPQGDSTLTNALHANDLIFQETTYAGGPVLDTALPIISKFGNKELRVGTARIGLSEEELVHAIGKQKTTFIAITAGFILLGLLISLALGKVLTKQILVLATGMQAVAKGDLDYQVKIQALDEIGSLAQTFNDMILKLQEKLKMEKYLSLSTLKLIKDVPSNESLKLGGKRCHVTVLFSDVRGFTSMSEIMKPEDVVSLLNIYLNLQAEVIYRTGGTVDKFVGDEVMAIFSDDGSEYYAARAAVRIQRHIKELNTARGKTGKRQISVGIGINNGEVVMGNMGSERQMDYTVIGRAINLAARLCSAAQPDQIIISKTVAKALDKRADLKKMDDIEVKGKKEPIEIAELLGIDGEMRMFMRKEVNLSASFSISGIDDESHDIIIKNIGQHGCMFESSSPCGVGSGIDLSIAIEEIKELLSIKATVRHIHKKGQSYFMGAIFQGLSEKSKNALTEWMYRI
jgi:class 3 adenylate cyclase